MHQLKAERSTLYSVMPMIQELKQLGFANVRFYSYLRWTHSLAMVLYQEMPFKARTGQALVYPRLYWGEYGFDMAPKFKGEEGDSGLNEWAESGMSPREMAAKFAGSYLQDQIPGEGCFSEHYYTWLDLVIEACPSQAFPVTEEPIPGGSYGFSETIEFYGVSETHRSSSILRPPGLKGMLEPQFSMTSAIAWSIERAKSKELSGFRKWNQRHLKPNAAGE